MSAPALHLVVDEIHRRHADPGGHPERPERIAAVHHALGAAAVAPYLREHPTPAPDWAALTTVHDPAYVERVRAACRRATASGWSGLDGDTYVTAESDVVAARFATATREATLQAAAVGELWFVLGRPPGHHAGRAGAAFGAPSLGFCLFNHAALALQALRARGERVLVIDFDVHHGNGTQEIFWEAADVVHIDVHQAGIYPGTGDVTDDGGGPARGTKLNIPLPAGAGDGEQAWVQQAVVARLLEAWQPTVVVVSAGFDAHAADPLAQLRCTEAAFAAWGRRLGDAWRAGTPKAIVSVLEGGYGPGLPRCAVAYAAGLLGLGEAPGVRPHAPPEPVRAALAERLRQRWGLSLAEV